MSILLLKQYKADVVNDPTKWNSKKNICHKREKKNKQDKFKTNTKATGLNKIIYIMTQKVN